MFHYTAAMSSIPLVDDGDVPSLRDDYISFSVEEGAGALSSGSAVISISFWTVHGDTISHAGATLHPLACRR